MVVICQAFFLRATGEIQAEELGRKKGSGVVEGNTSDMAAKRRTKGKGYQCSAPAETFGNFSAFFCRRAKGATGRDGRRPTSDRAECSRMIQKRRRGLERLMNPYNVRSYRREGGQFCHQESEVHV